MTRPSLPELPDITVTADMRRSDAEKFLLYVSSDTQDELMEVLDRAVDEFLSTVNQTLEADAHPEAFHPLATKAALDWLYTSILSHLDDTESDG